ncbi:hypothetical protein [Rhodoferax aquaticus]|uniref:Uncharacterized protein n=1 Tax=Rhodoferax aquaticus TaxID=2527691 RepID=A0A515ELR7_9BURK|nr:hypothetical protein [Rhodoferax aquaticus]QDL53615.1 hypothetical protein EXZ61_05160 [Rhodoferax aquaticus]
MKWHSVYWVVVTCMVSACSSGTNFSQHPGFASYYEQHPRRTTVADAQERLLLERHKPHVWLPAGHAGPIDFYGDYIAHGTLVSGDGKVQVQAPSQDVLNRFKADPLAVFSHRPNSSAQTAGAKVFARVDIADVALGVGPPRRFKFLSYHLVFRHSGLVAGLAWWQAWALQCMGDVDDWHQLDHYTAATVVLNESERPVALMLQQHNGVRTYVLGEGVNGQSVQVASDGRLELDVAVRSNELYPHRTGRTIRRAVGFVSSQTLPYLMELAPASGMASADVSDPAHEATYALAYLAPSDAFYSFAGYLGERRVLPGRDGPPGADYNAFPSFKPLGTQLVASYWREGNADDLARLLPVLAHDSPVVSAIQAQAAELGATLRKLGH